MLKIRMQRVGRNGRPYYRVVVSDQRLSLSAGHVEILGHYDPLKSENGLTVDMAAADGWIRKGAQTTPRIAALLKAARKAAPAV